MRLRFGTLAASVLLVCLHKNANPQRRSDGVWADGLMMITEENSNSPSAKYLRQDQYAAACEPIYAVAADVAVKKSSMEQLRATMKAQQQFSCNYTLMIPVLGELAEDRIDNAAALSTIVMFLSLAAASEQPGLSNTNRHFVAAAFAAWVSNDRDLFDRSICSASRNGYRTAIRIADQWPASLSCRSESKPSSPAPTRPKPITPPTPAPARPTSPPPPAPPPPPVTLAPVPDPKPAPTRQGSIQSVESPVPGYTQCRRIPLEYYDPDGKLVSDSVIMCRDANGEFIEVTGAE